MPNSATSSLREPLTDDPSTVSEKLSQTAAQVTDKMSDLGRSAANRIDESRDAAAGGLEKAASALHEGAESLPGGEKVSHLAHAAAEKLNSTAGYVREHNLNKMMADVENLVKNNPGPSLIAAAVIGFLAARAFSNND